MPDLEREIQNARDDATLDRWAQDFANGWVDADSYPREVWERRYFGGDRSGPVIVISTGGGDSYWLRRHFGTLGGSK